MFNFLLGAGIAAPIFALVGILVGQRNRSLADKAAAEAAAILARVNRK